MPEQNSIYRSRVKGAFKFGRIIAIKLKYINFPPCKFASKATIKGSFSFFFLEDLFNYWDNNGLKCSSSIFLCHCVLL
ncbi:MAG: hypothetical protein Ct9H300mP21_11380 [Pseudomonadota bacterium]|nr:MAG: hypothetical protein Ct9H300mP21_11380 [Pseudomonadota bacterium]